MNRIACGIVIGVLAVMALSPPALPRIVAHLRETGERIMESCSLRRSATEPSRAPSPPKGRNWTIG